MVFHFVTEFKFTIELAIHANVNVIRQPVVDCVSEHNLVELIPVAREVSVLRFRWSLVIFGSRDV